MPTGSFRVKEFEKYNELPREFKRGKWQPARPIPYHCFKNRIINAWHILTYKADALYWD